MVEKVYCIVKKGGNYYIPVKAELNPYNGKPAYLACLPNFFGGNKQHNETIEEALIREVREESQGSINIEGLGAGELHPLYQGQIGRYYYRFYLVTRTEGGAYFEGDVFLLGNGENLPEEQREMSCILKIPVNRLARVTNDEFLGICKNQREDLVNFDPENPNDENNHALMQWKTDEGTKDAFRVLF